MYLEWFNQGHLYKCGEHEIQYSEITEHLESFKGVCNIREFVYDPWKASQLAQNLAEDENLVVVEFRRNKGNYTEAMKELEGAITSGRFHHNCDPILNWEASNILNTGINFQVEHSTPDAHYTSYHPVNLEFYVFFVRIIMPAFVNLV